MELWKEKNTALLRLRVPSEMRRRLQAISAGERRRLSSTVRMMLEIGIGEYRGNLVAQVQSIRRKGAGRTS